MCQAAHEGPPPPGEGEDRRKGGSKAFPASGALSRNTTCDSSLSRKSLFWSHADEGTVLQEDTKEKKCLSQNYFNLETLSETSVLW